MMNQSYILPIRSVTPSYGAVRKDLLCDIPEGSEVINFDVEPSTVDESDQSSGFSIDGSSQSSRSSINESDQSSRLSVEIEEHNALANQSIPRFEMVMLVAAPTLLFLVLALHPQKNGENAELSTNMLKAFRPVVPLHKACHLLFGSITSLLEQRENINFLFQFFERLLNGLLGAAYDFPEN